MARKDAVRVSGMSCDRFGDGGADYASSSSVREGRRASNFDP